MAQRIAISLLSLALVGCASRQAAPEPRAVRAPTPLAPQMTKQVAYNERVEKQGAPIALEQSSDGMVRVPPAPQVPMAAYDSQVGFEDLGAISVTYAKGQTPDPVVTVVDAEAVKPDVTKAAQMWAAFEEGRDVETSSVQRAATTSTPSITPATGNDGYALHLASYHGPAKAEEGWRIYTGRFPEILEPLSAVGVAVSIPEKGDFIRLLAGPIANKQTAQAACDRLAARNQYCRVMRYDGSPL